MEPVGTLRIWQRSVSKLGLRYTAVISDGDSKSFAVVLDAKPYNDTPIIKHECVGHVQKQVGQYLCD